MIVSVHIPKAGGTSFRELLQREYGSSLLLDYDDKPLMHSAFSRNLSALSKSIWGGKVAPGIKIVHGHFLPLKYSRESDASFAIWLRDPVERVLSHFYFSQRHIDAKAEGDALQHSLENFVRSERFQNVCSKFLFGFDLNRFSFVGITERYSESLDLFARLFGVKSDWVAPHHNLNPDKGSDRYEVSVELRKLIEDHNRKDMEIYKFASEKNRDLLATSASR